jgi:FemAB family protein
MIDWRRAFLDSSLDVVFRVEDSTLWVETYNRLPYRPVNYLASALDYQLAYHRGHGGEWTDLSCVIRVDNMAVAIWPLTISEHDGVASISSQGLPMMPPLFLAECPERTHKKITAECLRVVNIFADQLKLREYCSTVSFVDQTTINNWQMLLMEKGAHCAVRHDLYVNLQLTHDEIKSKIRRRFRSLISSGKRLWRIDSLRSPGDLRIWEEFRAFHAEVAGRVTRSLHSWELQHQALVADEGFLIILRDIDSRMIGAGYYMCSADEGVYAVGVYDRSLFDKPLGHVVQYLAIEELKRRGCKWYRIGRHSYLTDDPPPTEKELSISHFKAGFSTHVFPSFYLVNKK